MKTLSASKIGFPCARHLWYCANEYDSGETDTRTQRIFDVGTYLEPMIVEWLRQDGWTVDYNAGSQNAELKLTIPLVGGELTGHPDCFISKPNAPNVLADIKTMNDRAFREWKRNGSLKSKPQYVDQLHVYAMGAMHAGYKVEKLAIVGLNKNNSDLNIDFFDYDWTRAESICKRAEAIFEAFEKPSENCPAEKWCCNYCGFWDICELVNRKETEVGSDIIVTSNKTIIDAVELLQEARDLSKTGKKLENEAKAVLDENVRKQGINSVKANNLILTLYETKSRRFDQEAFEKVFPELVNEFTKLNTSVTYKVKAV